MTLTMAFNIVTGISCAGTIWITTIFTGTIHTFFFLFGLAMSDGRFFPNTPLAFMTLAILFFDIFILPEKGGGEQGPELPQPRKCLMFALLTLPTLP